MTKIIKWFKNHMLISILVALIGIPILIHILYKVPAPCKFLVSKWNDGAGDILAYYGTILSCIATSYLAYFAIQQSKKANKINERLLKNEEINRKAYIKLNIDKTSCEYLDSTLFIDLVFDNITDVPIVEYSLKKTDLCLINIELDDEYNLIDEFEVIPGDSFNNMKDELYEYLIVEYNKDYDSIFSFEISINGLYGYETKQIFSLIIHRDKILNYLTKQLN